MPAKVGYLAIDSIDPNGLAPFGADCWAFTSTTPSVMVTS